MPRRCVVRLPLTPERQRLAAQWSGLPAFALRKLGERLPLHLLHGDAEGVAADVLVDCARLWREDGGAAFSTYYMRAAARRLYRELDQAGRRVRTVPFPARDDGRLAEPGEVDAALAAADLREALAGAMRRLSPRHRRVVQLRYLEGRTLQEAGQALGVTREAVRLLAERALARLRADPRLADLSP